MTSYSRERVQVDGGELAVGRWGTSDRVVVASHGITANHLSWLGVAELLAEHDVSLVAVDHRGRAGSAGLPGPYGLATHADDLAAVMRYYGGTGVGVGHSMGAFVSTLTAERHQELVRRLVLVDGGLPIPIDLPPDSDVEAVVQSVIGPALDRLDQRWPNEDAYVEFFQAHPAFQPPNEWTPTVEAYVRYDAVSTPEGEIRSSAVKDAVLVDGGAAIVEPETALALERITTPTLLLWAPRGILDQTPGLFSPQQVRDADERLGHLTTTLVDDTNHYTIACGTRGALAVSDAIRAAVG